MIEGKHYDPIQRMYGNLEGPSVLVVNTNGTTPVSVNFSALSTNAGNSPKCTITAVISLSLDTTAGNIVLTNAGATVSTIAKGATAGALVGAVTLANTAVNNGSTLSVTSSTAGNSSLLIYYTS